MIDMIWLRSRLNVKLIILAILFLSIGQSQGMSQINSDIELSIEDALFAADISYALIRVVGKENASIALEIRSKKNKSNHIIYTKTLKIGDTGEAVLLLCAKRDAVTSHRQSVEMRYRWSTSTYFLEEKFVWKKRWPFSSGGTFTGHYSKRSINNKKRVWNTKEDNLPELIIETISWTHLDIDPEVSGSKAVEVGDILLRMK